MRKRNKILQNIVRILAVVLCLSFAIGGIVAAAVPNISNQTVSAEKTEEVINTTFSKVDSSEKILIILLLTLIIIEIAASVIIVILIIRKKPKTADDRVEFFRKEDFEDEND